MSEGEKQANAHGHDGQPPLYLVILYVFVLIWAIFAWIPFFGY